MSSPLPSTSAAATAVSAPLAAWDAMYDKLVQFHLKHGHCRIPRRHPKLRKLFSWVHKPRTIASATRPFGCSRYDWASQGRNRESRWKETFERLEAYKGKHGDCLVPADFKGRQLVAWVKRQRFDDGWEAMPDERVRRLESLGFNWNPGMPSVRDEGGGRQRGSPPATPAGGQPSWDVMYAKLARHYRTYGTCSVSKSSSADLYNWILEQRVAYANNELSAEKRHKLDQIQFAWQSKNEKREEAWNNMFESLEAYKAAKGDCLVPIYHEDRKIYDWVKCQRFRSKTGKLPRHRRDRLRSIGFCWATSGASDHTSQSNRGNPPPAQGRVIAPVVPAGEPTSWDVMYEKLARLYRSNGNCCVSKSSRADLHNWVLEQRVANASNELAADKRRKLDKIHFPWMGQDEKHEEFWNQMFENLKAYKAANGDCLVPRSYCEDLKLYSWVNRQRDGNKTGKLPWHHRDRLQGIGFCWDTSADTYQSEERNPAPIIDIAPASAPGGQTSWDEMYEKLARHYRTYGHCRVARSASFHLHNWTLEQRVANSNNKLAADKRLKLDQIHFAWIGRDEKQEEAWKKMFETLKAYKAVTGDCLVSKSCCKDLKLYTWVNRQRDLNRTGTLPWHRRVRLQGIGFCWDFNPKVKETKQAPRMAVPEAQPNPNAGAPTSVSSPSNNGQQPVPRWNLQLERLKIYQARYGDCLVPTSYDKELAEWVSCQHYLNTLNKLGERRYGKLERIGFFSAAEAEKSLSGGTKRGASPGAPLESESLPIAGAQVLADEAYNLSPAQKGADRSRSPKRARVDGAKPSPAGREKD